MGTKEALLFSLLLIVPFFVCSCSSEKLEESPYQVISKEGQFEIRQYSPYIIAETFVDAEFADAGNVAFRRLFDYISGNNKKKASIAMTTPVNQQATSEKIAMTAPVNMQQAQGKYAVSFVMPAEYTMETIPEPLDELVTIREVDRHKAAAVTYSGTWKQKKYLANKKLLEEFIEKKKLTPNGEATFARYDPPFKPWFLRRNEVVIPVE